MVTYKELIAEIYKEYRLLTNDNDFAYFEKTIALDYNKLDKSLFIKELLEKNYTDSFTTEIFFCFPKLWCDLTIENWKNIVNQTIRQDVRPYIDNHGCFYDLFFLNKFLNINPFVLLEDNEKNKALIIKMQAFNNYFILNEVDIENLEDGTIPIADLLEETFKKLQVKDELISQNIDHDAFTNYLDKLAENK